MRKDTRRCGKKDLHVIQLLCEHDHHPFFCTSCERRMLLAGNEYFPTCLVQTHGESRSLSHPVLTKQDQSWVRTSAGGCATSSSCFEHGLESEVGEAEVGRADTSTCTCLRAGR